MMKRYLEQHRIRTVKPQFFKHERLFASEQKAQLPIRLAFIGIFGACNRWGCFRWQVQRLKSDIFPYDSLDFEAVLNALEQANFIWQYAYEGELYGCIPSWSLHQVIGGKEPLSSIPCLDPFTGEIFLELGLRKRQILQTGFTRASDSIESTVFIAKGMDAKAVDLATCNPLTPLRLASGVVDAGRSTAVVALALGGEGKGIGMGRGGKGSGSGSGSGREVEVEGEGKRSVRGVRGLAAMASAQISEIFEHWQRVMNYPGAQLDPKRKRLIQQALKWGYGVEALCEAITGCSLTPHNQGQNDRGERYDGLKIILRNADQIDRFRHNYQHPPKLQNEAERRLQSNIRSVQSWLHEPTENNVYENH